MMSLRQVNGTEVPLVSRAAHSAARCRVEGCGDVMAILEDLEAKWLRSWASRRSHDAEASFLFNPMLLRTLERLNS